jgi:predicted FMN-binding regulatory protein PaiB
MMFYDYYADVPEDTLREFVTAQQLGRLVSADGNGQPHIGLYPFVYLGDRIEMHLHRNDEQLADLVANQRCAFEVDEVLGSIPSHWVHASNAMFATAYHRAVIFECEATVSEDGEVLAAQQQRLMQHYQPDGGHTPVTTAHAMYRGSFQVIRALTLAVRARKVKWKLGQNRKPEELQKVIEELRRRGRATDAAAADALQWSMERNAAGS